jgi:hypothetical protein
MELVRFNEQSYQLELHAYRTTFPNFKYKPPSFVYVEIGISNRALATSLVIQHVAITKPINPLRSGTCLEIIPLHV